MMPKCHKIRYLHLEVSPAGCFSWLWTLCFTVFFFNSVFPVTLMRAGLPHMGMPAPAHSAVPAPPALLRHTVLCSLLHGLLSALCSMKCLFRFPKETSTRKKLIAFLFLGQQRGNTSVWIYSQHFLNISTQAGLTAKLLLKDSVVPMFLGHAKE